MPGSRNYVLVHGAWFGGWVWGPVAKSLRALGHHVSTPTLTGLGERRHLASFAPDLETHVRDITAHIVMEDLKDVDLVGWSYGGMVVSGVLTDLPDRIRSLTFLDAFAPEHGKSLADYAEPWVLPTLLAARNADEEVQPMPIDVMGIADPEKADFAATRITPQHWRTCMTPARVKWPKGIPITYIRCKAFTNPSFDIFLSEFEKAGHRTHLLEGGHVPMLDQISETTQLLADLP